MTKEASTTSTSTAVTQSSSPITGDTLMLFVHRVGVTNVVWIILFLIQLYFNIVYVISVTQNSRLTDLGKHIHKLNLKEEYLLQSINGLNHHAQELKRETASLESVYQTINQALEKRLDIERNVDGEIKRKNDHLAMLDRVKDEKRAQIRQIYDQIKQRNTLVQEIQTKISERNALDAQITARKAELDAVAGEADVNSENLRKCQEQVDELREQLGKLQEGKQQPGNAAAQVEQEPCPRCPACPTTNINNNNNPPISNRIPILDGSSCAPCEGLSRCWLPALLSAFAIVAVIIVLFKYAFVGEETLVSVLYNCVALKLIKKCYRLHVPKTVPTPESA